MSTEPAVTVYTAQAGSYLTFTDQDGVEDAIDVCLPWEVVSYGHYKRAADEVASLRAQLADAQRLAFRAVHVLMPSAQLGLWALQHIRGNDTGDVDAFALQDEAVKLGVIKAVPAPKPCGPCCSCVEYDADICYRDTDATRRTRMILADPPREGA